LNESFEGVPKRYRESLFSAISAGFFFLLVGAIFITTPNLFDKILAFFRDFDIVRIPNTVIYLPAPAFPRAHQVVHVVVEQFGFAFGLFQLVILALRLVVRSPWGKRAETTSNFVFWIGVGYLIRNLLINTTTWSAVTAWFVFWSAIIMLLGLSLIVKAIILALASTIRAT